MVAVAPGAVDTPIGAHQGLTPRQQADVRALAGGADAAGPRSGVPEEVAWAILRLADPAAGFVTGVVLPVDGGAVIA